MEKKSRKSLQSTVYQRAIYLLGWKIRIKFSEIGSNSKRQRLRQDTFVNLDQAKFKWFLAVLSRVVAVSTLAFKTKAIDFEEKINVENFKASDGWLDRWKKRFNVSFKTVSGESNACTDEMVAPWEQNTLPTVLSKYDLNHIYNADEFGLF